MRYLYSGVAWLKRRFQGGRKLNFGCRCPWRGRKVRLDAFSGRKKTEFWVANVFGKEERSGWMCFQGGRKLSFGLQMSSARKKGQVGCVFREEEN
ncbi:hypothetical protein FF1_032982 [Malus domestica]